MLIIKEIFGESIEYAETIGSKRDKKGPQNLLDLLPDVFTREEAQMLRQRMGVNRGSLKSMLGTWKYRGYITTNADEHDIFRKTERYINRTQG
jgi:DNA-binding MarR family transcriptional regulator